MISATHLHAIVIHFSIALLVIGYLFDVINFFYKEDYFHQSPFSYYQHFIPNVNYKRSEQLLYRYNNL
jgi:uncharacterized membrane protein